MKQEDFEARYAADWENFENRIRVLSRHRKATVAESLDRRKIGREFPAQYRRICHHLSLARARRYSLGLQHRLNQLALEGHQHLYRSRSHFLRSLFQFAVQDFPRALRRERRFIFAATVFFVLPGLVMAAAVVIQPELIYALLDPYSVSQIESMYDPANDVLGRERQADTDVLMFGYYVMNNISIGFRTFAGGLLFGFGSAFFLTFNGLFFGAIATHLTVLGYVETFWPFVSGHSALELTAIVIFGGIGLKIGYGAIAPGRKTRWHAIRDHAMESLPIIYGATTMLVMAAFVEAFWSSTTWPPIVFKYIVGGVLWLLVIAYFIVMGRNES